MSRCGYTSHTVVVLLVVRWTTRRCYGVSVVACPVVDEVGLPADALDNCSNSPERSRKKNGMIRRSSVRYGQPHVAACETTTGGAVLVLLLFEKCVFGVKMSDLYYFCCFSH